MNLYVDLSNLTLVNSATDRRAVTRISAKRGDALPLELRFVRNGAPVRLDASTAITFAIKESGKYDDDPVVLEQSFTASAVGTPDSDPHYTATPSLSTVELDTLFLINADTSDDPSSIDLMAEISWEATGDSGPTTCRTFGARIENDVYRGNEGTPLSQPTPLEWFSSRLEERGIYPIKTGASVPDLYPQELEIVGTLTDAGIPVIINPLLALTGFDINDNPEYLGETDGGSPITLKKTGTDWELETNGGNVLLTATFDVSDPNGIVFLDQPASDGDVTLVATDGKLPNKIGELAFESGAGEFKIWNGKIWKTITTT